MQNNINAQKENIPLNPQQYHHEKTEGEILAETQPIVGLQTKKKSLRFEEQKAANNLDKHAQIGSVAPTVWEQRDDIRIAKGSAIASTKNEGQPIIDETQNDPNKIKELNISTKYNLKEAYDRKTKKDIEPGKYDIPVKTHDADKIGTVNSFAIDQNIKMDDKELKKSLEQKKY